jgi:hypothetical protein
MKPIQIVAVDDDRISIPFHIPVKGRRPLVLKLPRFDFIPEDDFDQLTESIEALDKEDLPLRKYSRALALLMLKQFVSDKDYTVLETLATGQLDQILNGWREQSQVSLGESEASENSSTESTEAQSSTTSSATDTTAETSATPSDGTN